MFFLNKIIQNARNLFLSGIKIYNMFLPLSLSRNPAEDPKSTAREKPSSKNITPMNLLGISLGTPNSGTLFT